MKKQLKTKIWNWILFGGVVMGSVHFAVDIWPFVDFFDKLFLVCSLTVVVLGSLKNAV